jgi:2,4-dienoyl-CoA reductase-like NADH-dependent reductase (Old Yellow Enzyme family)
MTFAKPRSASDIEIEGIINGFAHAAEYLEKSGFDGIELHGAHGYLLGQFLSRSTNHRTDKYGGILENRSRIIFEIASAIRERVQPSFIIGIKINCVEFQANGFTVEEARRLCLQLEDNRFDFVELSGGTYESLAFSHRLESTQKNEAFFLDFAAVIAPELSKTKVYVTGGFKTAGGMTKALSVVDGVGLGRAVCQEPLLCRDIVQGKVTGAIRQLLDEKDFQITSVAAGAQMRQIGKGHIPIDLSLEENKKIFMADVGLWREKKSNDPDLQCYGYPDISIATTTAYRTGT